MWLISQKLLSVVCVPFFINIFHCLQKYNYILFHLLRWRMCKYQRLSNFLLQAICTEYKNSSINSFERNGTIPTVTRVVCILRVITTLTTWLGINRQQIVFGLEKLMERFQTHARGSTLCSSFAVTFGKQRSVLR